jgi:hypothetical protein
MIWDYSVCQLFYGWVSRTGFFYHYDFYIPLDPPSKGEVIWPVNCILFQFHKCKIKSETPREWWLCNNVAGKRIPKSSIYPIVISPPIAWGIEGTFHGTTIIKNL